MLDRNQGEIDNLCGEEDHERLGPGRKKSLKNDISEWHQYRVNAGLKARREESMGAKG